MSDTADSKKHAVNEVRDGSTAARAIPPGDSRPGWDSGVCGHNVVYSDPAEVIPGAKRLF